MTQVQAEQQPSANVLASSGRSIEGGLLAVTALGLVGWAWDPQAPADPPQVILLANEVAVGTARSDRFDIDLVRSRVGADIPGFIIKPSQPLPHDRPMSFTLRDKTGSVLGTPLVIAEGYFFDQLEPEISDGQYEGMVDGIMEGVLVGWVLKKGQPDHPVPVELHDGNDHIEDQIAEKYRGDLEVAGKRDGRCAFAFKLPMSLLDGRVHSLRVLVRGTHIALGNGPVQFGPLIVSALVEDVTRLRQETKRLQSLVERVTSPNGTLQSEIVRIMSDRVAAFAEIQRDMVERELDALRAFVLREDRASPDQPVLREPIVPPDANVKLATRRPPRRSAA